jgi:hypothetical protein
MGHHAEMRVTVFGDRHIVRFRDDCLAFDPAKYLELHNDNDPTSHLGIRTMTALSKEAIYINSLGLSNLTLKI